MCRLFHGESQETLTTALCVSTHYPVTIVCDNGLMQDKIDNVSNAVGSGTSSPIKECGNTFLHGIVDSEIRARYDVLQYISISDHANISVDPTTGHMLQTLQMI